MRKPNPTESAPAARRLKRPFVWSLAVLAPLALAVPFMWTQSFKTASLPQDGAPPIPPLIEPEPMIRAGFSNAHAAAPVGKTIVLQGEKGAIIGQMARIPEASEQMTEIKTDSEVDNTAGQELLSIIGKY